MTRIVVTALLCLRVGVLAVLTSGNLNVVPRHHSLLIFYRRYPIERIRELIMVCIINNYFRKAVILYGLFCR